MGLYSLILILAIGLGIVIDFASQKGEWQAFLGTLDVYNSHVAGFGFCNCQRKHQLLNALVKFYQHRAKFQCN